MSLHGNKTLIKHHHLPLSNLGRPAPSRNILHGISNRIAGNIWLRAHSQPQSHLKIQSLPASESSLSNAVSLHPSPPEPSPRKRARERDFPLPVSAVMSLIMYYFQVRPVISCPVTVKPRCHFFLLQWITHGHQSNLQCVPSSLAVLWSKSCSKL